MLHALTATTLAGLVGVPVATVTLAEPLRVASAADDAAPAAAPVLPPLSEDRADALAALRGSEPAMLTEVAAAKQANVRAAAARQVAAAKAAEAAKAAAEEAAAHRAAAAAKAAAAREKAAAGRAAAAAAARRAEVERRAAAERQAAAERRAAAARAAEQRHLSSTRASRSAGGRTPLAATGSPRSLARALLAARGEASQFGCLDSLWSKESGWSSSASNASSGAYGIPQALPGSKMASAGSDWRTNPATQVRWGIGYIESTYGSPCAAWSHSQADGWY